MVMCGFGAWGGAISLAQRRKDLRRGRVMVYGFGGGVGGRLESRPNWIYFVYIYIYLFLKKKEWRGSRRN